MTKSKVCFTFEPYTNTKALVMKKFPLLPRYFTAIGIAVTLVSLALILLLPDIELTTTTFVLLDDTPLTAPAVMTFRETDISITIKIVSLLLGLTFIAFSRHKIEDEMINAIRLYAFRWSMISIVITTIAATLLLYGMSYLNYCILIPHLLLVVYIALFYTNLYRIDRILPNEK